MTYSTQIKKQTTTEATPVRSGSSLLTSPATRRLSGTRVREHAVLEPVNCLAVALAVGVVRGGEGGAPTSARTPQRPPYRDALSDGSAAEEPMVCMTRRWRELPVPRQMGHRFVTRSSSATQPLSASLLHEHTLSRQGGDLGAAPLRLIPTSDVGMNISRMPGSRYCRKCHVTANGGLRHGCDKAPESRKNPRVSRGWRILSEPTR